MREGAFEVGHVCEDQINGETAGEDLCRGDATETLSVPAVAVENTAQSANGLISAIDAAVSDEGPGERDTSAEERLCSLEQVLHSELYPLKTTRSDEEGLTVPFPQLSGEGVEYLGRAADDGVVALSNYRLFILHQESFLNIPLGLIESIEYKDVFYVFIFCKDMRVLRFVAIKYSLRCFFVSC